MKQGQSTKRPRGHRGNGRRPTGGRNSNFESSGPQGKIRGTAYQVIEKYQALGRDALTFGDRVAAENYFQHAEHYYRVMVANDGAEQRGARQPLHLGFGGLEIQILLELKLKKLSLPNFFDRIVPLIFQSCQNCGPLRVEYCLLQCHKKVGFFHYCLR